MSFITTFDVASERGRLALPHTEDIQCCRLSVIAGNELLVQLPVRKVAYFGHDITGRSWRPALVVRCEAGYPRAYHRDGSLVVLTGPDRALWSHVLTFKWVHTAVPIKSVCFSSDPFVAPWLVLQDDECVWDRDMVTLDTGHRVHARVCPKPAL